MKYSRFEIYAKFTTLEEFAAEHNRLWIWRELWQRASNRDSKCYPPAGNSGARRSANAKFLATLQTRDERRQDRAAIKNFQVGELMKAKDLFDENEKVKANRAFYLSELRSGKYIKGTIFSDETTGKPIFPAGEDCAGSCACAIMHDLFFIMDGKKSGRNYLKALNLTPEQCRFIQQKINDTELSLPEIADQIEAKVFNSDQWKQILEIPTFAEWIKTIKPEDLPPLQPFQLKLLEAAQSGERFVWTGGRGGKKFLSDLLKNKYAEITNSETNAPNAGGK